MFGEKLRGTLGKGHNFRGGFHAPEPHYTNVLSIIAPGSKTLSVLFCSILKGFGGADWGQMLQDSQALNHGEACSKTSPEFSGSCSRRRTRWYRSCSAVAGCLILRVGMR